MPKNRLGRRALVGATVMAVGVGLLGGLAPSPGIASSHREAPLVAGDPQVDVTDVYAFTSPDDTDTVTLISSWLPLQEPAGGPNFYAWSDAARYDIKIDNDGDAKPDITYRWDFDSSYRSRKTFLYNTGPVTSLNDADLNFRQTYDLYRINEGGSTKLLLDDAPVAPSFVGDVSIPDYEALQDEAIGNIHGISGQSYVGQSDDPFFLDLRVFDLLYGLDLTEVGDDTLEGFNVNTMAIQVPKDKLAHDADSSANPIIGVWSTASRPSMRVEATSGKQEFSGDYVQVSRLGNPLVNEVVIPVGRKDKFNASKPVNDGQFLSHVTDPELAALLDAIYGTGAPTSGRDDLVEVFLTGVSGLNQPAGVTPSEQLRLNMSTPVCASGCSTLGVIGGDNQGFPNGRRLTDDTIDIAIQVVNGELVGNPSNLGDAVDANDETFEPDFPYVALPHSGSDTSPH
jgi:uncharacterized protein DUF4331